MDVVYYLSRTGDEVCQYRRFIEKYLSDVPGFVCTSIRGLVQRLSRIGRQPEIVVLAAADREDLSSLLAIRPLLSGIRIILILPDSRPDTVTQGLKLFPRYFTSIKEDREMKTVFEVLKKMVSTHPSVQSVQPLFPLQVTAGHKIEK